MIKYFLLVSAWNGCLLPWLQEWERKALIPIQTSFIPLLSNFPSPTLAAERWLHSREGLHLYCLYFTSSFSLPVDTFLIWSIYILLTIRSGNCIKESKGQKYINEELLPRLCRFLPTPHSMHIMTGSHSEKHHREKTLIYCWILSCSFFLALQHATIAVPHVILLELHPLTQGKMVTSPAQAALCISVGLWSGLKNMPLKIANRFIYKGKVWSWLCGSSCSYT